MPIAQYGRRADPDLWDERWQSESPGHKRLRTVIANPLARHLARHLPARGRVLEAGCGLGTWVWWMRERGLDAEGFDTSPQAIAIARADDPTLPIFPGDVRRIDRPDGYYDACVSQGVLEHFEEGPEAALVETRRLLRSGGVFIATVPCSNPVVRLRHRLRQRTPDQEFYQYTYTPDEARAMLERQGFRVSKVARWDVATGLKRHLLGGLVDVVADRLRPNDVPADERSGTLAIRALRGLTELPPFRLLLGHMLVCVSRRP